MQRRTGAMTVWAAVPLLVLLAACAPGSNAADESTTGEQSTDEWFDQAAFERQDELREATFAGDDAEPYLQYLEGSEMVDAAEYQRSEPGQVCFSNASLSNTWRQTGWISMNEQLDILIEQGVVSGMETRNAQDSADTQVADIDYFVDSGNCDGLIISPASSEATTAAVERACASGVPVVVFDRSVNTDCVTSFVHSIGNFAWGLDAAEFMAERLGEGDRVVALRTAAGVDLFEERWAASRQVFDAASIEYVDYITGADPAEIKKVVADELAQGAVDGVWVDLGDQSVPAIEAFQDAGVDVPVVIGEDNLLYLRAWDELGLDGFGVVYSNFQWRTAVLALAQLWQGEDVPADWTLPQEPVTADALAEVLSVNAEMPDVHSASCACDDLPGFPDAWISRDL